MHGRWNRMICGVLAMLLLALAMPAGAVVLDDENTLLVVLKDGTQVKLYAEAGATTGVRTKRFYYLPVNLRVAVRPDGTPQFLFMKFTTEKAAGPGAVSGALMHFLMEWGLTPAQEQEVVARLREKQKDAELVGAVPMEIENAGSFQIVSATMSDKGLTTSTVDSGRAPIVPGGLAAAASRMTAEGAQLMAATFDKTRSITDLSIALNYTYQTLMPAARGRVSIDWSRVEREFKQLSAEYAQKRTGTRKTKFLGVTISSSPTYSYSYDELREEYDFLVEKQVIKVDFDELVADERVAKIRDAFFQFFVNNMAEPAKGDEAPPPASDKEKEASPNIKYGNRYKYKETSIKNAYARKTQTFSLNYRLAVRRPHQLVGNLASWYDAVKDNPKCVSAVNLNDPFFQHRDINFIVDLDAKDIFEQAVNYVTVNVRKKRASGNPFADRVTIDAKHLKEKGVTAQVTYARGEDTDPDAYEYQSQWSLRGGKVYPPNPAWQKGSWEGVTLSPPVAMRKIEVEGDLEAMKASDISRITVQLHYRKFGEEVEENIHLSPAKNEPIVSQSILVDRDARGYAYRLIVNHEREGKLVLPWTAKVGDDYVFAAIPEDLLKDGSPLLTEAKEAGKAAVDSAKEKVLDKFKDVLGGVQ
jgi:hypothetical protein